ncbi:MAG TPA: ATP cone domain-containing protein [Anaerolineaceae bacterium]|nr:ATP cone domain-containing protein [Anaerolineaceae bacterium]
MSKIEFVIKRNGATVPFTPQRISNAIYRAAVAVGGRDKETAEKLALQVVEYLEQNFPPTKYPSVEDVQDAVEKILIENGHSKVAKAYILYRDERARMRSSRKDQTIQPSQNIPWAKIWQVLDWASSRDLHTVERYNQRIRNGEASEIIRDSEIFYEEDIKIAARMVLERRDQVKVVLITGPSSSGKTTTTIKLGNILQQSNIKLVTLNVDHYFFDLDDHPKDEFGDYDYEAPQALDLNLISEHLATLITGKEVKIPFYDFKTGKRQLNHTPMKLKENEMILIDSLHGLYPALTEGVEENRKFKLFLEPLLQMKDDEGKYIRWTDIRLMRRMLRDAAFRALNPESTLTHWHYVRTSELRNIIPNINRADSIINSAMPYELSIYKPKLLHLFEKWPEKFKDDPLRQDAYERSSRILTLLQKIEPLSDDSIVPSDSVIREFIGGSSLSYH